ARTLAERCLAGAVDAHVAAGAREVRVATDARLAVLLLRHAGALDREGLEDARVAVGTLVLEVVADLARAATGHARPALAVRRAVRVVAAAADATRLDA